MSVMLSRPIRWFVFSAIALVSVQSMAETGTLKLKFVASGDKKPQLPEIKPDKDKEFCGKHKIVDERLLINPDNGGIQNIALYVYTGRGGTKLKDVPEGKKSTLVLDNAGCQFVPHVVVARQGDTLQVINSDDVGHNANLQFINNKPINPTLAPKGKADCVLEAAEPAPIPVDCNIHPWMKAFVIVMDHPYVGLSDKDGNLEIKDLPAGEKIVFRFWYQGINGTVKEPKVGGKVEEWKNNRFELVIKPGVNDLGTVEIPVANFAQ